MKHILKTLNKRLGKLESRNEALKLSNDSWAAEHYRDLKQIKGLQEEKRVLMEEVERLKRLTEELNKKK